MNEVCPAQQYETACPRSELFERRRRRMEDRAAVSFPIHARFYSFQLPSSSRQARRQSAIYLTPHPYPSVPPVPASISDSQLKAESVLT